VNRRLRGQHVVIVGATSHIGAAIAAETVRQGGRVTLAGRDLARTTAVAQAIGPEILPLTVDLQDEESIRAAAARFQPGDVDHLVSVAAARAMGRVTELSRDAMVTALTAKIIGPILLAKHFTPLMPDTGSLLFFAGVGGWRPMPGGSVMAAGNGGVASLVAAMAVELAPIRANALSPGTIDTSAWDAVPDKNELFDRIAATIPARRVGTVQDVAAAATALLVNPFATGETLHLDGGARWV
jgi:NAD(P)-dependent dehydrogenase (short-subunit alcohol dehydrogenase family)